MIIASGALLAFCRMLKALSCAQRNKLLRGRQIGWLITDYFKTSRCLQEQYTWQGTETLQWQCAEKL